jgi:hypothetical protein
MKLPKGKLILYTVLLFTSALLNNGGELNCCCRTFFCFQLSVE